MPLAQTAVPREASNSEGTPTWFVVCVALSALGLASVCMWAASRQWFFADDFAFLSMAQSPRPWSDVFVPLRGRLWWAYRPLTTDVFFRAGLQVFGLRPLGYLCVSLAAHFGTGFVVYRLARLLGLRPAVALATAVFSRFRYPSMSEVFWISCFQYTATILFYSLSVLFFLSAAQGRHTRRLEFFAAASLTAALFSNELSVTIPLVMVLASLYVERVKDHRCLWIVAKRTAGYLLIVAAYAVFRLRVIGPPALRPPPAYDLKLGWHVFAHFYDYFLFVFGSGRHLLVFVLVGFVPALRCLSSRGSEERRFVKASLFCVGWSAVATFPQGLMTWAGPRWAIPLEVPLSLLGGLLVEHLRRRFSGRGRSVFDLILLAAIIGSVPYSALWRAIAKPRGVYAKNFVESVAATLPRVPQNSHIVVLFGGKGMGDSKGAEELRVALFGGVALRVWFREKGTALEIHDATRPLPPDSGGVSRVYFALLPDGSAVPAQPKLPQRPPSDPL